MIVSKAFSARLNMLRWCAALMVVASHARDLLFADYRDIDAKNVFIQLFYFITGFSHEAVMIFFVISGFLVGGLSTRKILNGRFDAAEFAIHRFSRIYVVLIPALIAGYALDTAGSRWFDHSHLYSHSSAWHYQVEFARQLGWQNMFGSVLMLQGVVVQGLGSNGPLWSLSYEWWYYTLFLSAAVALSSGHRTAVRIVSGLALVALVCLLPAKIMAWFVIWLAGWSVAVAADRMPALSERSAWVLFACALCVCRIDQVYFKSTSLAHDFMRDLFLACACVALFVSLARSQARASDVSSFHERMAAFSYSTYLAHFPFLIFVVAVLHDVFGLELHAQPGIGQFAVYLSLLAAAYAYSYVFSRLTESHTDTLRKTLMQYVGRAHSPAAAVHVKTGFYR